MPAPLLRGDVVLTPFPFTDLKGNPVRPALIVSPARSARTWSWRESPA